MAIYIALFPYALSAKPKLGIGFIRGYSSEEIIFSNLLREHIINIALSLQIFDVIASDTLVQQLHRMHCYDEQCTLALANKIGLSVLISGLVKQDSQGYRVSVSCYGFDIPYNGKQFCHYSVVLKTNLLGKPDREISYIAEEIAAHFIVAVCEKYKAALYLKNNTVISDFILNGTYPYYHIKMIYDDYAIITYAGDLEVINNKIAAALPDQNVIVLIDFKKEAEKVKKFYYGRKKEIVFSNNSKDESCILPLLTVPASATMPLIVPLLGYHRNSDYGGLFLWGINVSPYVGCEMWGLLHSPDALKKKRQTISRHDIALYHFSWYMLLAGGMPPFIDAFSQYYLQQAVYYTQRVPTLGVFSNELYLSILGAGSGMFFKGHRFWGYVYYHLTNVCIYSILYYRAQPKQWNEHIQYYINGKSHEGFSNKLLLLLSALKVIEVVHTMTMPYAISIDEESDWSISVMPLLIINNNKPSAGITCAFRF